MSSRKKVVVAMSGGVDSSVAAALLQRQGYDCVGVFMRLGTPEESPEACAVPTAAAKPEAVGHIVGVRESRSPSKIPLPVMGGGDHRGKAHHQGCCSLNDAADARYVAGLLEIPFYALNFQADFGQIIDYFVGEYNAGRTPNPCIRCNEYLKFGKLARYARAIGADYVASGHYARTRVNQAGKTELLRGLDLAKDQSYVLFGVPPAELERMLLPIGEMDKATVRQLAAEFKLPVFNKPDSQEICFVPGNDYRKLVRSKTPEAFRPGQFVNAAGQVLGTHEGYQNFTLGQRKGMGVAMGHPVYVTAIDPVRNTVTLGEKADLLRRELIADEVNWLAGPVPREPIQVMAKVRYNTPPALAMAVVEPGGGGEGTGGKRAELLRVRFVEAVPAITPGQAVVCYALPETDGSQRLLGGGWISEVLAKQ